MNLLRKGARLSGRVRNRVGRKAGPTPQLPMWHRPDVARGLVAGFAGGLVGSLMMNEFHLLAGWFSERFRQEPAADRGEESRRESRENEDDDAPATVKAVSVFSERVLGHALTEVEQDIAGPVMHYAFGTSVGGLYGALAEIRPKVKAGAGVPFGLSVWILADEIAVPVAGLGHKPTRYPLSTHLSALGAHIVYGLSVEFTRRLVRSLL